MFEDARDFRTTDLTQRTTEKAAVDRDGSDIAPIDLGAADDDAIISLRDQTLTFEIRGTNAREGIEDLAERTRIGEFG
jgi:hypothetical protein